MNKDNKQTILVVDDSEQNIFILLSTLEEKYNILVANDGESALSIIEETLPDLILLDIMMPGMDGLELCSKLKADESKKDIPIIFITSKTETEDIIKGFQVGGVDYITKPFKREEVQARVKTHMQLVSSQKQLKIKNKRLADLNEQKNAFVGIAAHDLCNPISNISLIVEMVIANNYKDINMLNGYMEIIQSSTKRMTTLITNLLEVSAIESGNLELEMQPASLKGLILERIQLFTMSAQKKGIKLHTSLSDINIFSFDPNHISQVIDNLVTNAIKFSQFNTNVYITLDNETYGIIKVSVRDEGPGISKEDQEKLYRYFQKLEARPTGGEQSTGLGLAIAKKVVETHNGSMYVDSQLGVGTTFSFTLPVKGGVQ